MQPESSRSAIVLWGSKIVSWLFAMLLLLGIPGVFCAFLLDHLDASLREERRRSQEADMREVLEQTAVRGNLRHRLQALIDRQMQMPWTPATLIPRLRKILQSHPSMLDVYLFAADGKRVSIPDCPDNLVFASQQVLKAIQQPGSGVSEKIVRSFCGNANVPTLLANSPNSLVELMNGDRNTYGGWWSLRDRQGVTTGHLLVFVHRGAVPPETLLDRAVNESNRLVQGRFFCGWFEPSSRTGIRPAGMPTKPGLEEALRSMTAGRSFCEWGSDWLVTYTTEAGERLFAVAGRPSEEESLRHRWRDRLLAVLLVGLVIATWCHVSLRRLRARLIWHFAIAGGFPLLVFLSMVTIDRENRAYLVEQDFCASHLAFLAKFDADFQSVFVPALRQYEMVYKSISADPAGLIKRVAPDLHGLIERMHGLITRLVVVDRSERVLFFGRYGASPTVEGQETLPHAALSVLQNVNLEPPSSSTAGLNNPIMSMLVQTKYAPQWIDEDGQINSNHLQNENVLSFTKLFPEQKAGYGAILMAMHDGHKGQIRYLQSRLGRRKVTFSRRPQVWALPAAPGAWPAFPDETIDRDPMIRKLKDLVVSTGMPQHQRLWLHNRMMLVSAMKGSSLDGYVLMMARPEETIKGPSRAILYRAVAASLLMLALTCITGIMTSRMLLRPLNDLGVGLVALQNRDFSVRVRSGEIRELALVAERFNLLLDNLQDLEMARSVQETLWPAAGLTGPGWRVEGRCVTAAALGGDFYDWFLLADGRLVVAVGDVAGHGIPSALVAAAAKVELAMNTEYERDPAVILASINAAFMKQVGRKRPMTFWLGLFDPATRQLHYANAGHNFPLAVVNGEKPCMLEGKGYPLGSRQKTAYVSGTLDLTRGGRVYAYSDGIIEAQHATRGPFDYSRFEAGAVRCLTLGVSESIAALFDEARAWSGQTVPDDDQTLVILHVEGGHV